MAKKAQRKNKMAAFIPEPGKPAPVSDFEEAEGESSQEDAATEATYRIYNPIKAGHTVTVTVDNHPHGVKFDKNCVSEPVIKEIYDILISLPRFEPYKEQ